MVTFHSGSGTQSDPFVIKGNSSFTTEEQLLLVGDSTYVAGGYYFRLDDDADFDGITWTCIGTSSIPFDGNFNGNYHTISGISGDKFMYVNGAQISNTKLYNNTFSVCYAIEDTVANASKISVCIFDTNTIGCAGSCIFTNVQCEDLYAIGNTITATTSHDVYTGIVQPLNSESYMKNIVVVSTHANATTGWAIAACGGLAGTCSAGNYENCVILGFTYTNNGSRYKTWSPFGNNARSGSTPTSVSKCYQDSSLPYGSYNPESWGYPYTTTKVETSLLQQQGFYDGTGISGTIYMDLDFDNIWDWDSENNRPILKWEECVSISTAQQLLDFAARVNAGENDLNAKLINDIDLTDVTWTIIGNSTYNYAGVFDGCLHTINNLQDTFILGTGCTVKNIIFTSLVTSVFNLTNSTCECCGFEYSSTSGVYRSQYTIWCGNNTIVRNCYQIQDSFTSFYNQSDSAYNAYALTHGPGSTTRTIENCYVKTNSVTIQGIARTKTGVSAFAVRTGSGTTTYIISNCVGMIGTCTTIGCGSYTQYRGRICSNWGHEGSYSLTGTNNYALETSMGITFGSATDSNGENVSQSTLDTQSFWENTMRWDFENVWVWDSENNLPKLKVSTPSFYIKKSNTWKEGIPLIKINGVWKAVNTVYIKVNGTWKVQT